MIYQIDQVELGINQVLQLLELTYGEGKSFHEVFFLLFVIVYSKVIQNLHFLF